MNLKKLVKELQSVGFPVQIGDFKMESGRIIAFHLKSDLPENWKHRSHQLIADPCWPHGVLQRYVDPGQGYRQEEQARLIADNIVQNQARLPESLRKFRLRIYCGMEEQDLVFKSQRGGWYNQSFAQWQAAMSALYFGGH